MPIPNTQIRHVEVGANLVAAAGGSNNHNFLFTFNFRRTTVINTPSKTAFETAFQATLMVPMMAALNNRATQTFNAVRWIDDALDAPVPVSRAVVGGVAGDSMAMHVSTYVLLRTGLRGKNYRGAKHFGPVSEADTTAGTDDILNAASLALWATFHTAWAAGFTDANGNVWKPELISRKLSTLRTNPTNIVANDLTLIIQRKSLGRMKKREVKSVY